MGRNQRRRSAQTKSRRNQLGDPFKAAIPRVAIPSSRNIRELEGLTPAFVCWYVQHPSSTDVKEVLASLKLFFRFYPEIGDNNSITALDPSDVAARLGSLIIHTVYEGVVATYSLMIFLCFLRDSGRWSGNTESNRAVQGILMDIISLDMRATSRGAETARVPMAPRAG